MRYLILGTTEAYDHRGQPLPVGGPRLRALLTSLAAHATRPATALVPARALIDDVWGDEPPHDASAALQALVGRLRRNLGKPAIQSAPGGYRLAAAPDEIDLAVYVISVLKITTAGAVMAWLLRTVRTGPWWVAGALGASYALCGWTLATAVYNPMWLDGLIALPLLCLVGEWALARRRTITGALLVAVAWMANFYTAYMATIGAALFVIARLVIDRPAHVVTAVAGPPRGSTRTTADAERETAAEHPATEPATAADDDGPDGVGSDRGTPAAGLAGSPASAPRPSALRLLGELWRPLVTLLLGVGLAAPLVSVIYAGTGEAYPGRDTEFVAEPWQDVFARLLPGGYGYNSPSLYVDTVALLLALTLPFNTAVPRRVRYGWSALVVAVLLSFQWKPTHLAWHAFTTPNGSQFRQTFVLCALLVIAAWLSLAHARPTWRALLGGGGVLAALTLTARDSQLLYAWSVPIMLAGAATLALALALWRFADARRRPVLVVLAAVLLLGMQVGQSAATLAVSDRKRLAHMDDYAPWGERQREQRAAIQAADGWPAYRTEPGRQQTVGNDPMLVGGQGAQYYSSLTSDVLSRTMTALGGGWTSGGRSVQSLDNPVTDVIFSVGARLYSPPDPHQRWNPRHPGPVVTVRQKVPPLVTVRPPGPRPAYGSSAYRNQELLLGARVYDVPSYTLHLTDRPQLPRTRDGGYRVPARHRAADPTAQVKAVCRPGSSVFLWAPRYWGKADLRDGRGPQADFRGDYPPKRSAAMQELGRTPANGQVRITLTALRGGSVPKGAIGCLDRGKLKAAADRLTGRGATDVSVDGATVRATVPAGSRGTAVVAMPNIKGWECAAGGSARPATSYLGLVSVPLDGKATTVSCTFQPPGLRGGAAAAGLALLGLVSIGAWRAWRARQTGRAPAGHPATSAASHD
ncbi:YfhO family protein [Streptomyces buecherae]|uniref:YfhO family protein n=1 Tax=Streptomyces buecherae TaxID=2763006 RepID=UPI0028FCA3AD|nr:YfhO family protein [Streptomyces buecherae]